MAIVEGLTKLLTQLQKKAEEYGKVIVRVGYTAKYAIYVHENMEQRWAGIPRKSGLGEYWGPKGAGPKFLEGPARELSNSGVLSKIVKEVLATSKSMEKAFLAAGLHLQRESQLRVPVEYGNLKNSAFTRLESDSSGNKPAAA